LVDTQEHSLLQFVLLKRILVLPGGSSAVASRPIAFGSVAKGGDSLSLQIRTSQFERPVDYFWTRAPYTPHELRRESHHFTW